MDKELDKALKEVDLSLRNTQHSMDVEEELVNQKAKKFLEMDY